MKPQLELIRRAQAGDQEAIKVLISRNQGIIYRLALSLLDDPSQATEVSRQSFITAFSGLDEYRPTLAFPTWLYAVTIQVCRGHLRQRRLGKHLARLFLHRKSSTHAIPVEEPMDRSNRMAEAANRLEDRLRLPLILRYDHDMSVNEMAPMLDQKPRAIQACLIQARRRLRALHGMDGVEHASPDSFDSRDHQQAQRLIELASDEMITDTDARWLEDHLKICGHCQAFFNGFRGFEDELRSALRHRWEAYPSPSVDFASAVVDRRRLHTAGRHTLNLVSATAIGLATIALVMFLPAISPAETLPPLVTPSRTPLPQQRYRAPTRSTFTPLPDNPQLLSRIYPGRLAYVPLQQGINGLFTMQPDGSDLRQIYSGFTENTSPAWSPDGKRIAFLASPGRFGNYQVFVVKADGSDVTQVSEGVPPGDVPATPQAGFGQNNRFPSYGQPRWSPDGRNLTIPWVVSPTMSFLALISPDTGLAFYLPADGIDRSLVEWSPDGKTIAYLLNNTRELWAWDIDMPKSEGRNPHRLKDGIGWDMASGLAWSPDASRIALLTGNREDNSIHLSLRFFLRDGSLENDIPLSSGFWNGRFPLRSNNLAWSPDGSYLAYMPVFSERQRFGSRIMLIRPDSSDQQTLVESSWGLASFAWSPDGRWIAFSTGFQIWAASLDAFANGDHPLVELTPISGAGLSWQKIQPGATSQNGGGFY